MDEQSSESVAPSPPPAPASPTGWRRHLTPPMVMSTLALFVALGGTGYAATKLPAKSVGNKQLQDSAVTSAKVKNGSLMAKDFKTGQLKAGPRGATGATGATGAPGAQGATGMPGPAGLPGVRGAFSSVVTRSVETNVAGGSTTATLFARCNADEIATGGGGSFVNGTADNTTLGRSAPQRVLRNPDGTVITPAPGGSTDAKPEGENSADGWTVTGTNRTGSVTNAADSRTLRAFVLCVPRP
jgi:hypothetical protein